MKINVSNDCYDISICKAPNYRINSTDNKTYDMEIDARTSYEKKDCYSSYEMIIENLVSGNVTSIIVLANHCTEIGNYSVVFKENYLIMILDSVVVSMCLEDMEYQIYKIENPFGTYYDIYLREDKFIIYGELEVRMLDENFQTIWNYSPNDVLMNHNREPLKIADERIKVSDWDGDYHELDMEGTLCCYEEHKTHIVDIDVSEIQTPKEFQQILKNKLGMPGFYGLNWDAFWDGITGLITLPDMLELTGWHVYKKRQPEDAQIFEKIMKDYNELKMYRYCECIYVYYE